MASPLQLHETPVCNVHHIPITGKVYYGHPFANALVHFSQVAGFYGLQLANLPKLQPPFVSFRCLTRVILASEGHTLGCIGQNDTTQKFPYSGILQIGRIPGYEPSITSPVQEVAQLRRLQEALVECGFHRIELEADGRIRELEPDEIIPKCLLQQAYSDQLNRCYV